MEPRCSTVRPTPPRCSSGSAALNPVPAKRYRVAASSGRGCGQGSEPPPHGFPVVGAQRALRPGARRAPREAQRGAGRTRRALARAPAGSPRAGAASSANTFTSPRHRRRIRHPRASGRARAHAHRAPLHRPGTRCCRISAPRKARCCEDGAHRDNRDRDMGGIPGSRMCSPLRAGRRARYPKGAGPDAATSARRLPLRSLQLERSMRFSRFELAHVRGREKSSVTARGADVLRGDPRRAEGSKIAWRLTSGSSISSKSRRTSLLVLDPPERKDEHIDGRFRYRRWAAASSATASCSAGVIVLRDRVAELPGGHRAIGVNQRREPRALPLPASRIRLASVSLTGRDSTGGSHSQQVPAARGVRRTAPARNRGIPGKDLFTKTSHDGRVDAKLAQRVADGPTTPQPRSHAGG